MSVVAKLPLWLRQKVPGFVVLIWQAGVDGNDGNDGDGGDGGGAGGS